MKIVINTCHGGFSLSDEAFSMLLNRKGIEFETVEGNCVTHFYRKGMVDKNEGYLGYHQDEFCRDDADLVAVVEALGSKANGDYAELKIVEVPDGVNWYIEDYDGAEHVAERQRTWR